MWCLRDEMIIAEEEMGAVDFILVDRLDTAWESSEENRFLNGLQAFLS